MVASSNHVAIATNQINTQSKLADVMADAMADAVLRAAQTAAQAYSGLEVQIVPEVGAPKGTQCVACPNPAAPGDVVAWTRRGGNYPVLLHRECILDLLDRMPAESGNIRGSLLRGFERLASEAESLVEPEDTEQDGSQQGEEDE